MNLPAPDPPDPTLAEYVKACLERLGPHWSEPEVVREALAYQRDLWIELYRLDNE